MIHIETVEQLNEAKQGVKSVLMFSAIWCGDCLALEPSMPAIEAEFPDMTFFHVDRDAFLDQCIELEIMGIPSFIVFNEGAEVARFVSRFHKTKEEVCAFLIEANGGTVDEFVL